MKRVPSLGRYWPVYAMGWACKASVLGIGSVWGLVLWAAVMGGVFGAGSFFRVGWHGGGGVFLVALL